MTIDSLIKRFSESEHIVYFISGVVISGIFAGLAKFLYSRFVHRRFINVKLTLHDVNKKQ